MKLIETIIHKLPAGRYIIVDPAYALWIDDYTDLEKSLKLNNYSGEMVVSCGNNILTFKTPFENKNPDHSCGILTDGDGFEYDIGIGGFISVVSLELCDDEFLESAIKNNDGRIISSDSRILCFFDNGDINIGEVVIKNKYKTVLD